LSLGGDVLHPLRLGPLERDLPGELGDLALEDVDPAEARRDVAEERDDEGVEQQVRPAADADEPGEPRQPVREDDGHRRADDEPHEHEPANRLVAGGRRRPGEQDGDDGDPDEEQHLDDERVVDGPTAYLKMSSTRMFTALSSDWPLALEY